jgi:hypothetical protein
MSRPLADRLAEGSYGKRALDGLDREHQRGGQDGQADAVDGADAKELPWCRPARENPAAGTREARGRRC